MPDGTDGYILGLDAGTSVVKAAIFDLQGNELSRGAKSVTPTVGPCSAPTAAG